MKLPSLLLLASVAASAPAADWPTARGNAQRTGTVDAQPGPKAPRVLWVHESTDHFLSGVSPGGEKLLFAPALGTLNSGVLMALSTDPAASAAKRVAWTKSQPAIKLPTVCAPAVVGGRVYFGDGMHQNENPTLYCLDAKTGASVWQLPIPGALVHLEATPTVIGGRAYFGAGNAGVLCVDTTKVTLDGKDADAATIAEAIATKWKEMQARYEEDKKKDPDFAIPPSEDALPKPAPKVVWQQGGNGKWHVDSPVAVAGDAVLVASARLDLEQSGERALVCVSAADGSPKWTVPLKHNPWGGPSVGGPGGAGGGTAVVGCSSIRFDPKELAHAKGEVVAVAVADGAVRWRKDVLGAVVSPVAIAGDVAVYTATDKKVYAVSITDGAPKWSYDARNPFFGGAAVAGDTVYAADLNGVVHAIALADGKPKWTLDVGKETKAPGNVYGSPVLDAGRLYVATCNVDAGDARKTVVVCIGDK
jgi:outer membrane protein assembly factor BamB